ncbi:hypothetical protein [Nesterenkonia muleiensis]|uniref:hypothetical protein n=1 Tax=Nesterenkonia muleiensis TaxID=2282648 RepID=UPI00130019B9|nr:hypothetical protein [Nesterenkonia muleiensis]
MKTPAPTLEPPTAEDKPEQPLDPQRDHAIDAAVRTGGVDHAIARKICQTMRLKADSALWHFAQTGHLDAECALAELECRFNANDYIPWISALWDYLERIVTLQRRESVLTSSNPLGEMA